MGKFPHSPRVSQYDHFKFLQKFAEIFASQGAPAVSTTPVATLPPVSTTPAANLPPVSLVLLMLVANLPPVSMIPEATCHWFQGPRWQICHQYQQHWCQICQRCHQHRWQNMETIPGCTLPKVNLKAKIYIYVNYPKVSKQNNTKFSDLRLFPFATCVNDTDGEPWASNISANFRKKIEMAVMVYSGAWENLIQEKIQKSRGTFPLR